MRACRAAERGLITVRDGLGVEGLWGVRTDVVGLGLWIWTGGFVGHVTWHVIVGLHVYVAFRLARERHYTSVANTPTSTNNLSDPWL